MELAFRADLSPAIARSDTSTMTSKNALHIHRKSPAVLRWDCIPAPGLFRFVDGFFRCNTTATETEVLESKEREQCVPGIVLKEVEGPELPACLNPRCNGRHLITDCDMAARDKARVLFVRLFESKCVLENKERIHDDIKPQIMPSNGPFLKRAPHNMGSLVQKVSGQDVRESNVIVQKGHQTADYTNAMGSRLSAVDDESMFSGLGETGKLQGNVRHQETCNHKGHAEDFFQRKPGIGSNVPDGIDGEETGQNAPLTRDEVGPELPVCLNPVCTGKHLIRDCIITGQDEARKLIVEFFEGKNGPERKNRTRKRKNMRSKKQ